MRTWESVIASLVLALAVSAQTQPQVAKAQTTKLAAAPAVVEGWPRTVIVNQQAFTVYQPQLESWDGAKMEANAAVSVRPANNKNAEPSYCVVWFAAQTEVDKANRLVTLRTLTVERVRFPGVHFRRDIGDV